MSAAPPALAPDLVDGLRRLKLAAMRRLAPELLRHREDPAVGTRGAAAHPGRGRDHRPGRLQRPHPAQDRRVPGDQDPRRVRPRRVHDHPATLDYLTSLEWITARENLCLVGPAGTGKSHLLVALGVAAVDAGHRVRYFTAAELVETLYRGLADNSVGRVIDTLLRNDLIICDEVGFAPLDDTGAQLLFRFIAAAYERRALGIASHWPFESWGRFLPEHTTAVSLLDRLLHHANVVVTDGESYRMREARTRQPGGAKKPLINPRGGDFYLATSGDHNLAVDRRCVRPPGRRAGRPDDSDHEQLPGRSEWTEGGAARSRRYPAPTAGSVVSRHGFGRERLPSVSAV